MTNGAPEESRLERAKRAHREAFEKRKFRTVIEAAWDLYKESEEKEWIADPGTSGRSRVDPDVRKFLTRLREEETRPQEATLKRALTVLWNPSNRELNAPLHESHKSTIGTFEDFPVEKRTRAGFVEWFSAQFEQQNKDQLNAVRNLRDAENAEKIAKLLEVSEKEKPLPGVRPTPAVPSSPLQKAVVAAVNTFIEKAGIQVKDGTAILGTGYVVQLKPLYDYVEGIQASATIPSYFHGVPPIPLDELYVDLSTSKDRRPDVAREFEKFQESAWSRADRVNPDAFARWARLDNKARISLPRLLDHAGKRPVVVFGDPGSGKSTLTRYLLHTVGRSLVDPRKSLGIRALPFRIALREFVSEVKPTEVGTIWYLVRHQLKVPEESVADWVGFLGLLTHKQKSPKLLILIDGLDEVTPESPIFNAMRRAWEHVTAIARLVFTSRRAGFRPPLRSYSAFELVQLSDIHVQELARNWFRAMGRTGANITQGFITWLFADSRRQEMAGNPCLLTLLCFLNLDWVKDGFLEAPSRARLYELAVDKLMKDAARQANGDPSWALPLLEGFALERYSGAEASPTALFRRQVVYRHLQVDLGTHHPPERTPVAALDAWMEMRLVFQWDCEAWYHFIHQTFQEYFAAKALTNQPHGVVRRFLEQHRFNPYWREVWRFYAGLCADLEGEGRKRFQELASSLVNPQDAFGEVAFHLAPLCAEFGLRQTSGLLGYELKSRLFEVVRERHRSSIKSHGHAGMDSARIWEIQERQTFADASLVSRVRLLVELDPQYFLEWARTVIDDTTISSPGQTPLPETVRTEILWALLVLNCISHPQALDYQRELIRREAAWKRIRKGMPPLGPCLRTGRNESLCGELQRLDLGGLSQTQQHRILRYLVCTQSNRAGQCVQRIAASAKEETAQALNLQLHCLEALCQIQDFGAVTLAKTLLQLPKVRASRLPSVWHLFSMVRSKAMALSLQSWFESEGFHQDPTLIICILKPLKEWKDLKLPSWVDDLLEKPELPLVCQTALWELVVAREGSEGIERLEKRMSDMISRPSLREADCDWLLEHVRLLVQERIPRFQLVQIIADRFPARFVAQRTGLLSALIKLRVMDCHSLDSEQWLLQVGVPMFRTELLESLQSGNASFESWKGCWSGATPLILAALRDVVLESWEKMEPEAAVELFHEFLDYPALIPVGTARRLLDSESEELRQVGMELLLELDPGLLIRRCGNEKVSRFLRNTSINSGVLFFQDRLYNPGLPGYVEYSKE
jgi:hypothetical protein